MKKHLLLTSAVLLLLAGILQPETATAQKKKSGTGAAPAFDKGSSTLGVFLGLGVSYYDFNGGVSLPAVGLLFDHGIVGNVGPGTIGIGGILAFKSSHYNYDDYFGDYKSSYNSIILGVRGSYHLTILKDKNNKFDPYAGIMAGIRISTHHTRFNAQGPGSISSYDNSDGEVVPVGGGFVGAKYNFKPSIGAFAEAGFDISFLRLGVNFNF